VAGAGLNGTIGILLALAARERTGSLGVVLGADTKEILLELGYTREEIDKLQQAQAIE